MGFMRTQSFYEAVIQRQKSRLLRAMHHRTGLYDAVIVTFSTIQQRNRVHRRLRTFCPPTLLGGRLAVAAAKDPADTIYENLDCTARTRLWKIVVSYVIVAVLIFAVFFLALAIRYTGRSYSQTRDSYVYEQFTNVLTVLVSATCDQLFRPLINLMQRSERHASASDSSKSWMVKYYSLIYGNRLAVYYSRQFLLLLAGEDSFFNIFDPSRSWSSGS